MSPILKIESLKDILMKNGTWTPDLFCNYFTGPIYFIVVAVRQGQNKTRSGEANNHPTDLSQIFLPGAYVG